MREGGKLSNLKAGARRGGVVDDGRRVGMTESGVGGRGLEEESKYRWFSRHLTGDDDGGGLEGERARDQSRHVGPAPSTHRRADLIESTR